MTQSSRFGETIRLLTNNMTMFNPLCLLTLAYVLFAMDTLSAANSSSSNSGVSHSTKANVYNTYNNYCAGPSKKIETLLHEVKKELSEMREEIKSLTGNRTIGKSVCRNFAP